MKPGRPENDTSAVFVRIPASDAERLDRAAFELKAPKRDLIAALISRYVDPTTESGLRSLRELTAGEDRRIVIEPGPEPLTVGRHSFRAFEEPEVLDPAQVAELLQVEESVVLELAVERALPARKVGDEWRFSRRAVLDWLAAAESA
jgi:excisionase family DNA binding protein